MVVDDKVVNEKENTATMVWETLQNNEFYPLLWNAFPFHPFKGNNPDSNRAPSKVELNTGLEFIKEIINLFNIKDVVAIGNKAQESLNGIQIQCKKIRHPSRGGKNEFVTGIKFIC